MERVAQVPVGVSSFITRWANASPSERANSQPFLVELCDVLGVERPDPRVESGYSFEHVVVERHVDGTTSQGRIDLYKRGCFVLESKQFQAKKEEATQLELAGQEAGVLEKKKFSQPVRGSNAYDDAMTRARGQAERYVKALPNDNPPFILVVDVGHSFEVFADFTQAGKAYLPFPDPRTFRIRLSDLADEKVRERLRLVWTNPAALDPSKVSADVTREISGYLAELAKSLEQAGHEPEVVAQFLTRCLFCMFAEDVGLLPENSFSELLKSVPSNGEGFRELLEQLFREMDKGTGHSVVLRKKLLRFNGGLFADHTALPLNGVQLGLLKQAASRQWRNVEPAIFGTLLERALNPNERHQLGAHFTPRAYVERLVLPTIVEPLREEWASVFAAAVKEARKDLAPAAGKKKKDHLAEARKLINGFHEKLCNLRILDPACGTGNFLYVALQQLKALEGEVMDAAAQFGETFKLQLSTHTIDPHQFLGIEINPRAAAIAELVLWIGYLQWHFKLHGKSLPSEPILRAFRNIECRDAVLEYDGEPEPARDENGKVITVWDRRSYKTDNVTGREVPDESKRVALLTYKNPRPTKWPEADFIVGNPPFIGAARMREDLGDGYAETLRETYPEIPESADFVLYWWHKAAELVRSAKALRFGLITTNSLRQTFARRIVQAQLCASPPLSLAFAIPDHPWVDTAEGAQVRIAMTVGVKGDCMGDSFTVIREAPAGDGSEDVTFLEEYGKIASDLRIGADVTSTVPLKSNEGISCPGVKLHGSGFILTSEEAMELGLEVNPHLTQHIRPYRNGKDLTDTPRGAFVIDLFGLSADQALQKLPAVYQIVLTRVKPERDSKAHTPDGAAYARSWWLFGKTRQELRKALSGQPRYIATVETAKHRFFQFLDANILPDNMLIAIALSDAFDLGILSSRIHVVFSLAAGGTLEDRPRYNKTRCFDPFPFPVCSEKQKVPVRRIAEDLDAHRKRAQAVHGLTLTGIYNVLEKLRAGEALNAKEKDIHDKGLVSVLKQLHDDLDAAVFDAYGWPTSLTDAEILERLVALNAKRAEEEKRGIVRWLRPEYQNAGARKTAPEAELPLAVEKPAKVKKGQQRQGSARKKEWPSNLAGRVQAVQDALEAAEAPSSAEEIAGRFSRAKAGEVAEILETLETLGRAHRKGGRFSK